LASITSKGQVAIPKRVRERLGVETPGMVRFRETDEGDVVVERVRNLDEYRGVIDADESAAELVADARSIRNEPNPPGEGEE
jgi:AbrB family looped-hinge helix DNA binding protein